MTDIKIMICFYNKFDLIYHISFIYIYISHRMCHNNQLINVAAITIANCVQRPLINSFMYALLKWNDTIYYIDNLFLLLFLSLKTIKKKFASDSNNKINNNTQSNNNYNRIQSSGHCYWSYLTLTVCFIQIRKRHTIHIEYTVHGHIRQRNFLFG